MTTTRMLWADREFGDAVLGDERRTRRAVEMAGAMAASPGGTIGKVFGSSAQREAAYRFVENGAIDAAELTRSAQRAAVRRCFGERLVFVPIDGTSLNLSDSTGIRGMGSVGTHGAGAQGIQVMSAIGVLPGGIPVGVLEQRFWRRLEAVGLRKHDYDARPVSERETRHWLDTIASVQRAFVEGSVVTRPFFQLDRGGDVASVLARAVDEEMLLTTRAAQNRRIALGSGKQRRLFDALQAIEPQGSYVIDVPEGKDRKARRAVVHVQFCQVALDLRIDRRSAKYRTVTMNAVRVVEIDTTPRGEERIEWILLTTYPIHDIGDALFVVEGYTYRWRIEQFHKTWKSGACRIEESQLQSYENVVRFAVLSASVAMRVERLTHLCRSTPDAPATDELTRHEIDAAILLRRPVGVTVGQIPSIADAVRWIADIGGFMGPAQKTLRKAQAEGRPVRVPGAKIIRRGLERIEPVAMLLATKAIKL